jgi:hypothetical protein
VRQRLAADVQDTGDEDVGARHERVDLAVDGLGLNALDDGVDLLVGRFALEEAGDLAAFCCKGGVCTGQRWFSMKTKT